MPAALKGLGHGMGQGHRRGKQQGLAVGGVRLKGGEDLRRGIGREQQGLQLGLDKIPVRGAQRVEVGLEQDLDGPQVGEIARLHHLQQGFLVDNALKDLPQRLAIAALRRGGDADDEWSWARHARQ